MTVLTNTATTPLRPQIGGAVETWVWQGEQPVTVVYETLGQGDPVLLLPAMSTVSTRGEMAGLAQRLAPQFQAIALDWPGFGDSDRLPLQYQASLYDQFLQDFVNSVCQTPLKVIAAGHSAGYVMKLAASQPGLFAKIVLVAPTWRGPLPTMGASPAVSGTVRNLVRSPIFGQLLYKLNTTPAFLRLMYRRHVYTDSTRLTPEFMREKWNITQQPGARFAPAAFVTGTLDPASGREEFLNWFQPLPAPIMVIVSDQAPPGSKAEMQAIANLEGVEVRHLSGSLGLHEEHPSAVLEAVQPFLQQG
ncbi:alpha/beta hydrolase [Limnoraphis robusta Tam1]|uniref:Alpha/beta hydrolase n=1 Tax=Limnoraphis robusta CCNP1315 TaxID=3110306 RepID=A0ABU5TRZ6_9CYAN|nr:alpha/beta hydrolase [Limnoraphis robusta]MEA5498516.1 alpha/beta hydrolase [Limnoraphis robusta BA-68 BA1]MEA5517485.1 alpha/beta hydrolase [Limnoraphis robusta CCNP1315]MEA5542457.1 alpha/beta hydrolase [Limnoraphis robusta Tam1]MEA5548943.1 alpha/beta hydrolase [Limnoraphis robusta CCNP1324]